MLGWLRGRAVPQGPVDVTPEALVSALAGSQPPLVVDVRTPQEYAEGHIQQARLLPLSHLGSRVGELPNDRPIVCVCRSGSRSRIAARLLSARGYRVQNMTGGMLRWHGPVATGGGRGA